MPSLIFEPKLFNKCIKNKAVCNGDTAYITRLKQYNHKDGIALEAYSHNVSVFLSNSTF